VPDSALYWTAAPPQTGWHIIRADDGTWRAEEIAGPRSIADPQLINVLRLLAGDDAALQRRYSETQVRAAATSAGISDSSALVTALRGQPQPAGAKP
jgi:hypothetical protein